MRPADLRREEGLTLVELLVTMVVGTLVVGALTVVTLTGFRSFESADRAGSVHQDYLRVRALLTEDVRSASPPSRPPTTADVTRVELCPTTCPALAPNVAVAGRRLVLGIYDDRSGQFRTVTWEYDNAAGTLTRRVTVGSASPGAPNVVAKTLVGGFTSAFTLEADGFSVTLALPVPPFNADGTVSDLRKLRLVMRSSAAATPFRSPTPTPAPTPTPTPVGQTPTPTPAPTPTPTPTPPPQTVTLAVTDGFDLKANKTLSQAKTLSDVQAADTKYLTVDAGFFTSFQFQQTVPSTATILSVKVFVRHYEDPGIGFAPVAWEVGGGSLTNPTITFNRIAPVLVGKANEATQEWDVTGAINTAAKVNDLKLVVRNTDGQKEETFLNFVYVVVIYQ